MFSRLRIITSALVLAMGSPQWVIHPVLQHAPAQPLAAC